MGVKDRRKGVTGGRMGKWLDGRLLEERLRLDDHWVM